MKQKTQYEKFVEITTRMAEPESKFRKFLKSNSNYLKGENINQPKKRRC
jgi:hypothetical protein